MLISPPHPATSPASASLMASLRAETATAHHQLEGALDLLGPALDRTRYIRLVAAFDRFLTGWEPLLAQALPAGEYALFADRQHSARTRLDLRSLAAAHGDATVDHALRGMPPVCDSLPVLGDAARGWGSAYVIEGSTLGGRVISRHLTTTLGLTPENGASYFAGYGANTGVMWNEFRRAIEAHVPAAHHANAVDVARDTFTSLHRWMTQCGLA